MATNTVRAVQVKGLMIGILLALAAGAASAAAPGTQKWVFPTGAHVFCSPAVGLDGTIYVGSEDGNVYALNGGTGAQKWVFTTGGQINCSPAIGPDGTVYVGSYDGHFYAINGQTGVEKWAYGTNGIVTSSPAIGSDGTVFIGNGVYIVALNGQTGGQKWAFTTGGTVESSPAIGLDDTVYVGSDDGRLYAVNGKSGVLKWAFTTTNNVTSSPAIGADGTVYFGSYDFHVYALDGQTGAQKWKVATGYTVTSSPALGSDGTVYVGSDDNNVYALDGQTGTTKWTFATQGEVDSSPAVGSDGVVYIGSRDNNVYALDGQTGVEQWEFATLAAVFSPPTIGSDGTVYVGSYDNNVYALNSSSLALQAYSSWPMFHADRQHTGRPNNPLQRVSADLHPTFGGYNLRGLLLLSGPAPNGGLVVTLTSDNPSAILTAPATALPSPTSGQTIQITIQAGGFDQAFGILTSGVPSVQIANISASCGSLHALPAAITIEPASLREIVLKPTVVTAGSYSGEAVTLNGSAPPGGLVVTLSSDNPNALITAAPSVFPTPLTGQSIKVTIPFGASEAPFRIMTNGVAAQQIANISASTTGPAGSTIGPAVLTLNPAILQGISLLGIKVNQATVTGGGVLGGTATLSGKAPTGGFVLNLVSDNSTAILSAPAGASPVPASGQTIQVTVPAGATSVSFTVTTGGVAAQQMAHITGNTGGPSVGPATVIINPAALKSLSISPTSVKGGHNIGGIVVLTGRAPAGGLVLTLSSDNAAAAVTAAPGASPNPTLGQSIQVTVPAGQTYVTFTVKTSPVAAQQTANITVTDNGVSLAPMALTITP